MYSRENACSDLFDKSRSGLDSVLHFLTIISQWGNSNKLLHQKKTICIKDVPLTSKFSGERYRSELSCRDFDVLDFTFQTRFRGKLLFSQQREQQSNNQSCWEKKAISQLETSRAVHTPRCSVFFKLFVVNTYPIDAMCCKGNCEENLHIDLWVPLSEWWKFRGVFECFITL